MRRGLLLTVVTASLTLTQAFAWDGTNTALGRRGAVIRIEPQFVCQGCGSRGADVRPDFERGDPRRAITSRKEAAN